LQYSSITAPDGLFGGGDSGSPSSGHAIGGRDTNASNS